MNKTLTCIVCPRGCLLKITDETPDGKYQVSGNLCKRGIDYAINEQTCKARVVTMVGKTDSPEQPYLPLRTDKPLKWELIDALLNEIYHLKIATPVKRGAILIENYRQSGVNVIYAESSESEWNK